ncbi:hypothetical protein Cni_G09805 [Canna indica]|uniref:Uncharacterized protein n=1 Tax=Canna indica TaxID=4628 RepID=A0AAQ3K395_9LILI|nr:hypothetical protein Cni_G09805 [Canna indica]
MKVSQPGPRRRLHRPHAMRNRAVVSIASKSPKLRRWTILGGPATARCRCRRWNLWWGWQIRPLASSAAARSSKENAVMLDVRRKGGRGRLPMSAGDAAAADSPGCSSRSSIGYFRRFHPEEPRESGGR